MDTRGRERAPGCWWIWRERGRGRVIYAFRSAAAKYPFRNSLRRIKPRPWNDVRRHISPSNARSRVWDEAICIGHLGEKMQAWLTEFRAQVKGDWKSFRTEYDHKIEAASPQRKQETWKKHRRERYLGDSEGDDAYCLSLPPSLFLLQWCLDWRKLFTRTEKMQFLQKSAAVISVME